MRETSGTWRKHKIFAAWVLYVSTEVVCPMLAASPEPSRRALCCTAVVKKEEECISSQRSNLEKRKQARREMGKRTHVD